MGRTRAWRYVFWQRLDETLCDFAHHWHYHSGLKQTRDNLLAQLNELSKKKRRGSAEENAKSECEGLESKLNFLRDELVRPPVTRIVHGNCHYC
jgi:hypothetical protein